MFPLTSSSREKQERRKFVVIRLIENRRKMQRAKENS
jgi:hypothetical protein